VIPNLLYYSTTTQLHDSYCSTTTTTTTTTLPLLYHYSTTTLLLLCYSSRASTATPYRAFANDRAGNLVYLTSSVTAEEAALAVARGNSRTELGLPPLQPPPPPPTTSQEGAAAQEGGGSRDLTVKPEVLAAAPQLLVTLVRPMQT